MEMVTNTEASSMNSFQVVTDPLVLKFFHACRSLRNLEAVKELVASGVNVDSKWNDGTTALWDCHDESIVKELLRSGADPNICRESDNNSPLMVACEKDWGNIVEILIKGGADVNAKDSYGNTPLSFAIEGCGCHAVYVLLGNGAKMDDRCYPLMNDTVAYLSRSAQVIYYWLDQKSGRNGKFVPE